MGLWGLALPCWLPSAEFRPACENRVTDGFPITMTRPATPSTVLFMPIHDRLQTYITTARLGAIVALGGVVLLLSAACGEGTEGNETPGNPTTPPATQSELLVRDDSPILGQADAPVTMVEFLDPECESCRGAYPLVKQLLDEYPDELRVVIRYFPLHGNSVLAAQATEAAGEQGKYAEMQALLFERQPEWGEQQASQEELFVEYARELDLDMDKFSAALNNADSRQKVERDRADGIALGVTGTPTFFVDGQWISQPGYEALKAAIDQALE